MEPQRDAVEGSANISLLVATFVFHFIVISNTKFLPAEKILGKKTTERNPLIQQRRQIGVCVYVCVCEDRQV